MKYMEGTWRGQAPSEINSEKDHTHVVYKKQSMGIDNAYKTNFQEPERETSAGQAHALHVGDLGPNPGTAYGGDQEWPHLK